MVEAERKTYTVSAYSALGTVDAATMQLSVRECPENYVLVPAYSANGSETPDFCVMKYEARNDGAGKAVSIPDGDPWTYIARGASGIDAGSAWKACKDLGPDYDLISNAHWQAIALQIESATNPELTAPDNYWNWSGNSLAGSSSVNQGHTNDLITHSRELIAADENDANGCAHIGDATANEMFVNADCGGGWHQNKRTHWLPNGEVIWDLAGNAMEWVRDHTDFSYDIGGAWSLMSEESGTACVKPACTGPQGKPKAAFGPAGNYSYKASGLFGGLGEGLLSNSQGAILRGGAYNGGMSGIFYVTSEASAEVPNTAFGFRCIRYLP